MSGLYGKPKVCCREDFFSFDPQNTENVEAIITEQLQYSDIVALLRIAF